MQKLIPYILILTILNIDGNASLNIFSLPDTLDQKTRLKELWQQFRRDNKVQIHKFEGPDSMIWFGSNKKKDFLTSVMISSRVNQENSWFLFNSSGIFKISVVDWKKTRIANKRKRASCSYYFENDKVFHKIEEGKILDLEILLLSAKKYQELACPYLRDASADR